VRGKIRPLKKETIKMENQGTVGIVEQLQSLLSDRAKLEAENAKLKVLLAEVSEVNALFSGVAAKVNRQIKGGK
jgi:hypothetical protein